MDILGYTGINNVVKEGNIMYIDIVNLTLKKAMEGVPQVLKFSKNFEGNLHGIWGWVRQNIKYKEDAYNQLVKSPAALWHDREGDCKSYSVFIWSVLKALNVKAYLRFVSYSKKDCNPTHVYVVTDSGIILDACIGAFNVELPHYWQMDLSPEKGQIKNLNMQKLISVNGPENENTTLVNTGAHHAQAIREYFAAKAESEDIPKLNGVYKNALDAIDTHLQGGATVNGIFDGIKNFVTDLIQNGQQLVANVKKEVIDELTDIVIPKVAPYFLYMFIVDEMVLAKLPQSIKDKRAVQANLIKLFSDVTKIPLQTLLLKVRTGIIKAGGKEPEVILKEWLSDDVPQGGGAVKNPQQNLPVQQNLPNPKSPQISPPQLYPIKKMGMAAIIISSIIAAVPALFDFLGKVFGNKAKKEDIEKGAPTDSDRDLLKGTGLKELLNNSNSGPGVITNPGPPPAGDQNANSGSNSTLILLLLGGAVLMSKKK